MDQGGQKSAINLGSTACSGVSCEEVWFYRTRAKESKQDNAEEQSTLPTDHKAYSPQASRKDHSRRTKQALGDRYDEYRIDDASESFSHRCHGCVYPAHSRLASF